MDASTLVLSLFIGLIGMSLMIYGKKQSRIPHVAIGLLLCAYPYFVSNLILMAGIAAFLLVILGVGVKFGL